MQNFVFILWKGTGEFKIVNVSQALLYKIASSISVYGVGAKFENGLITLLFWNLGVHIAKKQKKIIYGILTSFSFLIYMETFP